MNFPFYTYLENQNISENGDGEEWGTYLCVNKEYAMGYMLKVIWKDGHIVSEILHVDKIPAPYTIDDLKVERINKQDFINGVKYMLWEIENKIKEEVTI